MSNQNDHSTYKRKTQQFLKNHILLIMVQKIKNSTNVRMHFSGRHWLNEAFKIQLPKSIMYDHYNRTEIHAKLLNYLSIRQSSSIHVQIFYRSCAWRHRAGEGSAHH